MRRLIPIIVLALLLTGCKVKVDQGFELNSDGSGTASLVFGFDDELMEMLNSFAPGGDPLQDMNSELPAGWSTEDWSEGVFTGMRASKDFADLAELRSIASLVFSAQDGLFESFVIEETDEGGFRFEAVMSGEALEQGFEGMDGFDMSGSVEDLGDTFFDAGILVKLPGEVVSHNADREESDGTLVWTVGLADGGRVITAESTPGGGLPIVPLAIGLGVALLAVLGFVLWKQRSSGPEIPEEVEAFAEPAMLESTGAIEGDPFG